MTGLAVAGAQFRLKPEDRLVLQQRFLPWALRAGNNCHDLMTIYYEQHLEVRGRRWKLMAACLVRRQLLVGIHIQLCLSDGSLTWKLMAACFVRALVICRLCSLESEHARHGVLLSTLALLENERLL